MHTCNRQDETCHFIRVIQKSDMQSSVRFYRYTLFCKDCSDLEAVKYQCSCLNRHGPHRLICLNVWPIRNGTTKRGNLVGVGGLLCENELLWRQALRSPKLKLHSIHT